MTIICPYQDCQQQIEAEAQNAGTEAKCPTCKRPMQLPEIAAFPAEESQPAPWRADEPAPQNSRPESSTTKLTVDVTRGSTAPLTTHTGPQPTTETAQAKASETALSPDPDEDDGQGLVPGGSAGCPKCMRAFDEDVQGFVRELVELREFGGDVSKLGVKCPCGAESKFDDIVWIKSTANDVAFHSTSKRPSFHPPNSSRDRAKIMSDAGFLAVRSGDMETAHTKWLQATEADQSWSVPFFNLARLSLDRGDRHAASAFLGLAEDRAGRGSSADDVQVMKQVSVLKLKLEAPLVPE